MITKGIFHFPWKLDKYVNVWLKRKNMAARGVEVLKLEDPTWKDQVAKNKNFSESATS